MKDIRQHDHYSLRNTIRAGCIQECWLFFDEMTKGVGSEELRRSLADGRILSHYAYSTRMALWKIFRTRYLNIPDSWILSEIIASTHYGPQSPEFISLLYLYFILRDKLAFDFVTHSVWEKWKTHHLAIGSSDSEAFYTRLSLQDSSLLRITAASKGKLNRNLISTLQDFGLIFGTKHRVISPPPVAARTAFHLLRLLSEEGRSGKEILTANDWRIFLWDEQDVSLMLNKLSRKNWIKYEKSGNIVLIEVTNETGKAEGKA
jgi:hypothetical protein